MSLLHPSSQCSAQLRGWQRPGAQTPTFSPVRLAAAQPWSGSLPVYQRAVGNRGLPLHAQGAGARSRRFAIRLLREALSLDEPPLQLLIPDAAEGIWGQQPAASFPMPPLAPVMVPPAALPQLQRFMCQQQRGDADGAPGHGPGACAACASTA